jgi:3-methyladenine DNA glycosylase AlkC
MVDQLKNNYNRAYIKTVASEFKKQWSLFDDDSFIKKVFNSGWKELELKERMKRISYSLHEFLPKDYNESIPILLKVAPEFGGFEAMFFPDFVENNGLDKQNWKLSIKALEELTQYSSSEFAIRPFIIADSKETMKTMLKWSKSKSYHVRRLASEGCRPRLPWAIAIDEFKKDPNLILPILENLKNDPELYVRRSVANNLNDISKDHPKLALKIASSWLGKTIETDWVVKHGLRTLLKKGDSKALKLFGYSPVKSLVIGEVKLQRKRLKIGETLEFKFTLTCKSRSKLRVEYAIDYLKKNGTHSKKVFKISEKLYEKGEHIISSKQSFKEMSTRKHYRGPHFISIVVNGVQKEKYEFRVI